VFGNTKVAAAIINVAELVYYNQDFLLKWDVWVAVRGEWENVFHI